MRRVIRLPISFCAGLTLGLLLLTPSAANAQLAVSDIGLYDGSNAPTVYITYTGSGGSAVDVYADPQTATNALWQSDGSPIPLYCIDTVHENYLGSSYQVNVELPPITFSTSPVNATIAANEVAWAVENASTAAGQTGINDRAATQLFVWWVVDPNFNVANWNGNSGAQTDFNSLTSLSGYHPNASNNNYLPGVLFLDAVHDGDLYQDLALAVPPGDPQIQSLTPEPSSLLVAVFGALGLVGYGWRKRRRHVI
jgi:PEP-CTERM motif